MMKTWFLRCSFYASIILDNLRNIWKVSRIIFIYWLAAPSSQTMVIPVTAVSVRNVYILDRVSQSDNNNEHASHNRVISVPQ